MMTCFRIASMNRAMDCLKRLVLLSSFLVVLGCRSNQEVIVYCAVDREISEPILKDFEKETGITVRAKYDTESTKSVGLAEEIMRFSGLPRCDVFWNNEAINMVRLEQAGKLVRSAPSAGESFFEYSSSERNWFAVGGRTRVLLVNTELCKNDSLPTSLEDLGDPKWKNRIAMAKPLFGMTATHIAVLHASWGAEKTRAWLQKLKQNNVQILAGNRHVAQAVSAGQVAVGMTDTDDAQAELAAGKPVKMLILPAASTLPGILVVPTTVAKVKGCSNPIGADRLIDYLVTHRIEQRLVATGGFLPLYPQPKSKPNWLPADMTLLKADWKECAKRMELSDGLPAR